MPLVKRVTWEAPMQQPAKPATFPGKIFLRNYIITTTVLGALISGISTSYHFENAYRETTPHPDVTSLKVKIFAVKLLGLSTGMIYGVITGPFFSLYAVYKAYEVLKK